MLKIYQASWNRKTGFRVSFLRLSTIKVFFLGMSASRAVRWSTILTGNVISFALRISAFSRMFQRCRPPCTLMLVATKENPKSWNGSGQKRLGSAVGKKLLILSGWPILYFKIALKASTGIQVFPKWSWTRSEPEQMLKELYYRHWRHPFWYWCQNFGRPRKSNYPKLCSGI